jgi:hypothetical protein
MDDADRMPPLGAVKPRQTFFDDIHRAHCAACACRKPRFDNIGDEGRREPASCLAAVVEVRQVIGRATQALKAGEHTHVHNNVVSGRQSLELARAIAV